MIPSREQTQAEMDRIYGPVMGYRLSQERSFADQWEERVALTPAAPFVLFEEQSLSFADFDAHANRLVRAVLRAGVRRGEVVGLLMLNRPEYFLVWIALAKAGIVTAFLNTGARDRVLAHALRASNAVALICGSECEDALATLTAAERPARCWRLGDLLQGRPDPRADSLDALLAAEDAATLPRSVRAGVCLGDDFVLIFTSGTTGLPKAARMSHLRFIIAGETTVRVLNLGPADVWYTVLPLFHGAGGMVAPSTCVAAGIPLVLRRKFSASAFWPDVRRHRITTLQYVGEICRYLTNAPPVPGEREHSLRNLFGAGLRADVWQAFRERFGVARIVETWGGTETNCNLQNLDGPIGSCGRIPFPARSNARLVRFDPDTDSYPRNADGWCIACEPGEVGEMLGQIYDLPDMAAGRLEGYTSAEQTESRILRDAFAKGDRWYRTGDLLRFDADGYFYFVDRSGDTFRWKSENVSTEEVARVLGGFPGPVLANVYGVKVPNTEGRAGMVALSYADPAEFDSRAFHEFVQRLPHYARPVFVRITAEADMTASFKLRKFDLQREGYDPSRICDPLYVLLEGEGRYARLEPATLRAAGLAPFAAPPGVGSGDAH